MAAASASVTATATDPGPVRHCAGAPRSAPPWVEQDPPRRWWAAREREYAGATCAALVSGMAVRRRGDVLHVRAGGRWHALAVVPRADVGGRHPSRATSWVHFDLDVQNWFTFGRRGRTEVPVGSGWRAVRWLAVTTD